SANSIFVYILVGSTAQVEKLPVRGDRADARQTGVEGHAEIGAAGIGEKHRTGAGHAVVNARSDDRDTRTTLTLCRRSRGEERFDERPGGRSFVKVPLGD